MHPQTEPDTIVSISVSASGKIRRKLDLLLDAQIESLSHAEWALRHILMAAQAAISSGSLTLDVVKLRAFVVDNLKDEGEEHWRTTFDDALELAKTEYFTPHPDSQ